MSRLLQTPRQDDDTRGSRRATDLDGGRAPGVGPVQVALALFLGALTLLLLTIVGVVVLGAIQLNATARGAGLDVAQSAQAVQTAVAQGVGDLRQTIADATDPFHPPRYPIQQDPEFDQLQTIAVGQPLGEDGTYRYTIAEIIARPTDPDPSSRAYARIHRTLLAPRVTAILGLTIRTDDDPRDDALYRGQEFHLGSANYKVNLVSPSTNQVVILRFVNAADATGPFVFSSP